VSSGTTGPIPTGTINLSNGSSILLSGSLDSAGRLSLNTTTLPVGAISLIAQYSGDQNYTPSNSSPLTETIAKGNVTMTASTSANPSVFGHAASLLVHAASSGGGPAIPTGTVTLFDSTSSQGSLTLDASGAASFSLAPLNAGAHSLSVNYSGDSFFNPSSSTPISQIINKSDSAMLLATSSSPSVFGQAVQITATVQASANGGGTPSGSVIFSDGASPLGFAVLNNGKAVLSTSALGVGSHSISATYSGDGNFNPSSASGANGVTQTVAKSGTSTIVAGSPNPSVFGQAVTLNVNVAASGGGSGSPTGMVTFGEGAVPLGTATVATGAAALTVSSFNLGAHIITVAYSGDGNFSPSTSASLSETVLDSHSAVVLTSSANPQVAAQPVTFVATVTAALGGPLNSGAVTFSDGPQHLGTIPVLNSIARFTTTTLAAGNHQIAASYQAASAPGPFDGTSAILTEVINTPSVGNADFTMAIQQSVANIHAGQSFTTKLTLTPINGLTGLETTMCQGAPRGVVCKFTPDKATFDGKTPIVATFTISTSGATNSGATIGGNGSGKPRPTAPAPQKPLRTSAALELSSLCAFGCVVLTRFKRPRISLVAVALLASALAGCGASDQEFHPPVITPPGTYTINVQSQRGSLVHSKQMQLIVR
jgi:hypothetical protein